MLFDKAALEKEYNKKENDRKAQSIKSYIYRCLKSYKTTKNPEAIKNVINSQLQELKACDPAIYNEVRKCVNDELKALEEIKECVNKYSSKLFLCEEEENDPEFVGNYKKLIVDFVRDMTQKAYNAIVSGVSEDELTMYSRLVGDYIEKLEEYDEEAANALREEYKKAINKAKRDRKKKLNK